MRICELFIDHIRLFVQDSLFVDDMHVPVLLKEVLEIFDPKPGEIFIDATINGGGHARAILGRVGPEGRVIGIEWDSELIALLKSDAALAKAGNLTLIHANYRDVESVVPHEIRGSIKGVLFDFGYSSYHIASAGRGFSFSKDEPLDMRYNTHGAGTTAKDIVNTWPEKSIADLLREYGEERFARRIANRIAAARKTRAITKTSELVRIIESASRGPRGRIHPATRTFQALRIRINDELENIRNGLGGAARALRPGGIIIAISFHSLEDRIVKDFFREMARQGNAEIITKKPIMPAREERGHNPRARSAKLRALRITK